jgi:hypothetical protein
VLEGGGSGSLGGGEELGMFIELGLQDGQHALARG